MMRKSIAEERIIAKEWLRSAEKVTVQLL